MTYGHPTRSKWGSFVLGDCRAQNTHGFAVDSSIRICPERGFSVDSLIGVKDVAAAMVLDSLIRATEQAGFSVDSFNLRLPTDLYRLPETHPAILVELRLSGGTLRVASRNIMVGTQPFVGRLVNAAAILRTITEGTDEVQLSLDDTSQRGARFRDLFAVDAPEGRGVSVWIGLTDDPSIVANRLHLFEGKIERVPGFSRAEVSIDVVRNEIVDDRLVGRLITLTDFPDAPAEVLGLVVPIVFGTVEVSKGVVINTNARDRLFFNHFIADTTFKLQDTTAFPVSGTLQVRDEQIVYTGKNDTAKELTGVTRGANGTIASDHAKATEVRELGPFVVKFHDGTADTIDDIKILDPNGNLGEPVPGPTSIDHALSTATWDELPRIRSAGVEALFQRVHFNAQVDDNLALDAHLAARENPGYDTFEYAKVSPGAPLKIRTNINDLGQPGDIKRVWIAVVHDAAPPAEIADEIDDGSGFVEMTDGEVAESLVFQTIFDSVPLPDGGFTNATTTAERVRNSIDDDGVNPAIATFNELTRSVHGIPNGYDVVFATGLAGAVQNAVNAQQVASAAHAANVASAQIAASAASNANIAAGATVTFPGKAPASFQLVDQDLTPIEIARFDDRTNDRLYDVEVQTEPFKPETKTVIAPVEIEHAGIWSNAPKVVDRHNLTQQRENAESIFDGNDDTTGDATFNIPGEVNAGDGPGFAARVKFLEGSEEPESSGFKAVHAYVRVWVDTVTLLGYIYAPLLAYITGPQGKAIESEVRCRHFNELSDSTFSATGCILAPKEYRSDVLPHGSGVTIPIDLLGSRLQNVKNLRMVLEPGQPTNDPLSPINCLNYWIAHTCDLIIELEKEPPPEPVVEDRKGITNHFEMTEFVSGDWEFFSDPLRGGSITIESNAGEIRILEAFWVVEYQPFFEVSSSVPDVFANVAGTEPLGNPAAISESIVSSAPPHGMGLGGSSIAREDYNPARAAFDADAIRADFTVDEQVNALQLLALLADQCGFRQAWSQGKHRIVLKPALGGLLRANGVLKLFQGDTFEAFRDLKNDDVLRDTLAFSRTSLADTRTRSVVKFKPLPHTNDFGGSVEVINDPAEVEFGRKEEARTLPMIRDAATAELVTARDLLRRSSPRFLVEMSLPLFALELKLGDLVSLNHLDLSFDFGEVLNVSVETMQLGRGPFITIKLELIVWLK